MKLGFWILYEIILVCAEAAFVQETLCAGQRFWKAKREYSFAPNRRREHDTTTATKGQLAALLGYRRDYLIAFVAIDALGLYAMIDNLIAHIL